MLFMMATAANRTLFLDWTGADRTSPGPDPDPNPGPDPNPSNPNP